MPVGSLLDGLVRNLETRGKATPQNLSAIKTCRQHFGLQRAVDVNASVVEKFQSTELRRENPPAPGTINRTVEIPRAAFRLAQKQERVSHVPAFPLLPLNNTRQGFVEVGEFERLVENLPAPIGDFARFAYLTAWRKGQISKLEWSHVDQTDWIVAVPGTITKNKRPQTIPVVGQLRELIEKRWEAREVKRKDGTSLLAKNVFHEGRGRPVREFRKTWAKACRDAGFPERVRPGKRNLPGIIFHDLRRSGVRNLVRSGVDPHVVMKISGHRTPAILQRYNIVDVKDQQIAFAKLEKHLAKAPKTTNVVNIR
jgi:integrase